MVDVLAHDLIWPPGNRPYSAFPKVGAAQFQATMPGITSVVHRSLIPARPCRQPEFQRLPAKPLRAPDQRLMLLNRQQAQVEWLLIPHNCMWAIPVTGIMQSLVPQAIGRIGKHGDTMLASMQALDVLSTRNITAQQSVLAEQPQVAWLGHRLGRRRQVRVVRVEHLRPRRR